ncbi:MAG: ABC transporter permease, partial [Oscillospiraceae bacterium]
NLTNINICERTKELATIKVLGFHERETAAYIYRETNILCLFGIAGGFGLGKLLHIFVVRTAEIDSVMFGRNDDAVIHADCRSDHAPPNSQDKHGRIDESRRIASKTLLWTSTVAARGKIYVLYSQPRFIQIRNFAKKEGRTRSSFLLIIPRGVVELCIVPLRLSDEYTL